MTTSTERNGNKTVQARPTAGGSRAAVRGRNRADFVQRWALVGAWATLVVVFSVIEPDTFFTLQNLQSVLGSQAILLLLTLGLMIPLTTGDFDLSIGGVLSLSAMMIAVLNGQHGQPVVLVIVLVLLMAVVVGAVNAALIVGLGIESLIVTLGMGTVAAGITLWISDSQTISGISRGLTHAVVELRILGVPVEFYYGLIACVVLWYILDHTALGRRMLFTGRGKRVARLSGVNVRRLRFGSLVASSVLAALAGVLYAGTSGAANPGAGEPLLLPAFAAVFLGATAISPGRFNPWGTFIAVYFLASGITGLQLLGIASFVQNLFYGGALIVAVIFAQLARRRYVKGDDD